MLLSLSCRKLSDESYILDKTFQKKKLVKLNIIVTDLKLFIESGDNFDENTENVDL